MSMAQQLAMVARAVALEHKRRDWRHVAKGVWLRADKVETFHEKRKR